jgi:hypothetical protein
MAAPQMSQEIAEEAAWLTVAILGAAWPVGWPSRETA